MGSSSSDASWTGQATCFLLLAGAFVFVAVLQFRYPVLSAGAGPKTMSKIETRIDPNAAPWHELARLPDIGEQLAREIVAYREQIRSQWPASAGSGVVFRSLEDLDPIPGIGEKRLAGLALYLKFPGALPGGAAVFEP